MSSAIIDAEIGMRNAISDSGFVPPNNISLDGSIHRFDGVRKRGNKKNCWYVGHTDPVPVIIFGDWKTGFDSKYVHASKPVTTVERNQISARMRELKRHREAELKIQYQQSARQAQDEWSQSKPAKDHLYLVSKDVSAYRLRVNKDGLLLIPATDGESIHSLQYIWPGGRKMFLLGGKIRGHFYPIAVTKNPSKILICEGAATGLTLYEDMEMPAIVAFNSGNLAPVAETIRWKFPDVEILICSDDDYLTPGNPGATKAAEAAARCGGGWILPDFTGLNRGPKDTDFNDLKRLKEACHA